MTDEVGCSNRGPVKFDAADQRCAKSEDAVRPKTRSEDAAPSKRMPASPPKGGLASNSSPSPLTGASAAGTSSVPPKRWLPPLLTGDESLSPRSINFLQIESFRKLSPQDQKNFLIYDSFRLDGNKDDFRAILEKGGRPLELLLERATLVAKQIRQLEELVISKSGEVPKGQYYQFTAILKAIGQIYKAADARGGIYPTHLDDWLNKNDKEVCAGYTLKTVYKTYFAKILFNVDANDIAENAFESRRTERDRIEVWRVIHPHPTAQTVLDALTTGELRNLSEDNKRYFLGHVFLNFSENDFSNINALAELVVLEKPTRQSENIRLLVAELLLRRAINPPTRNQNLAPTLSRAFALAFLRVMQNDVHGLGQMLAKLTPEEAFDFARSIDNRQVPSIALSSSVRRDDPRLNDPSTLSKVRSLVLAGLNDAVASARANKAEKPPVISTMTLILWQSIGPGDFIKEKSHSVHLVHNTELAHNLALALANDTYPEAAKAARLAHDLEALLRSRHGVTFLCAGPVFERKLAALEAAIANRAITPKLLESGGEQAKIIVAKAKARAMVEGMGDEVPNPREASERLADILLKTEVPAIIWNPALSKEDRNLYLSCIVKNSTITADAINKANDPWEVVAEPIGKLVSAQMPDSATQALGGHTLDLFIATLLKQKPVAPKGVTITASDLAALENFDGDWNTLPKIFKEHNFFADNAVVQTVKHQIMEYADTRRGPPEVGFKIITTVGREFGRTQSVLFSVRTGFDAKGKPTYAYIGDDGAPYTDHIDNNNKRVAAFNFWRNTNRHKGFMISHNDAGTLAVEKTPHERNTVKKYAHKTATVVSGVAMVAATAATGGTSALLLGITAAGFAANLYLTIEDDLGLLLWWKEHGRPPTPRDMLRVSLALASDLADAFTGTGRIAGAISTRLNTAKSFIKATRTADKISKVASIGSLGMVVEEISHLPQEERLAAATEFAGNLLLPRFKSFLRAKLARNRPDHPAMPTAATQMVDLPTTMPERRAQKAMETGLTPLERRAIDAQGRKPPRPPAQPQQQQIPVAVGQSWGSPPSLPLSRPPAKHKSSAPAIVATAGKGGPRGPGNPGDSGGPGRPGDGRPAGGLPKTQQPHGGRETGQGGQGTSHRDVSGRPSSRVEHGGISAAPPEIKQLVDDAEKHAQRYVKLVPSERERNEVYRFRVGPKLKAWQDATAAVLALLKRSLDPSLDRKLRNELDARIEKLTKLVPIGDPPLGNLNRLKPKGGGHAQEGGALTPGNTPSSGGSDGPAKDHPTDSTLPSSVTHKASTSSQLPVSDPAQEDRAGKHVPTSNRTRVDNDTPAIRSSLSDAERAEIEQYAKNAEAAVSAFEQAVPAERRNLRSLNSKEFKLWKAAIDQELAFQDAIKRYEKIKGINTVDFKAYVGYVGRWSDVAKKIVPIEGEPSPGPNVPGKGRGGGQSGPADGGPPSGDPGPTGAPSGGTSASGSDSPSSKLGGQTGSSESGGQASNDGPPAKLSHTPGSAGGGKPKRGSYGSHDIGSRFDYGGQTHDDIPWWLDIVRMRQRGISLSKESFGSRSPQTSSPTEPPIKSASSNNSASAPPSNSGNGGSGNPPAGAPPSGGGGGRAKDGFRGSDLAAKDVEDRESEATKALDVYNRHKLIYGENHPETLKAKTRYDAAQRRYEEAAIKYENLLNVEREMAHRQRELSIIKIIDLAKAVAITTEEVPNLEKALKVYGSLYPPSTTAGAGEPRPVEILDSLIANTKTILSEAKKDGAAIDQQEINEFEKIIKSLERARHLLVTNVN